MSDDLLPLSFVPDLIFMDLQMPVMGGIVMPAAVLSAVLAPFGLSWVGLKLMAPGIDWILRMAEWVSGFEAESGAETLWQAARRNGRRHWCWRS